MKKIKPIKKTKKGIIYDHAYNVLNDDWLRAARLKEKADKGDKEVAAELKRMATPTDLYLKSWYKLAYGIVRNPNLIPYCQIKSRHLQIIQTLQVEYVAFYFWYIKSLQRC